MAKNVDISVAGSVTVALLCVAVAILLRSFYKRYMRMKAREAEDK